MPLGHLALPSCVLQPVCSWDLLPRSGKGIRSSKEHADLLQVQRKCNAEPRRQRNHTPKKMGVYIASNKATAGMQSV